MAADLGPDGFHKLLHSRLPYFIRRKLGRRASFHLLCIICLLTISILFYVACVYMESSIKVSQVASSTPKAVTKQSAELKGINPEDRGKYVPDADGAFRCFPSGTLIPFKQVNDNFCDCPLDGSDEPSTGACPNSDFKCSSPDGKVIRSSRVNDGICDCCDGSDEWNGEPIDGFVPLPLETQKKLGKYQAPCPNVC